MWLVSRFARFALPAALLAGCATAYQPHSSSGGYKDRPDGANRHFVEFHGNGKTTRDTVLAYWLYRCAELAQERRFDHFVVISRDLPPGATPSVRGLIELRKGPPAQADGRTAYPARELIALLGPAVARPGRNVALPPRFALAEEPRRAPREQETGAVRLEDLEALLPR